MTEYLGMIAGWLNSVQSEVSAAAGFPAEPAPAPLLTKKAYVTAERIAPPELDFKVLVFIPADLGGEACIAAAEALMQYMEESFPVRIKGLHTGSVSYSDDCMAFIAAVTGTLTTAELHSFRADEFSTDAALYYEGEIPSFRIVRSFEQRPVMTMLSDIPLAYHDGENRYEITLFDVPTELVENISESGSFTLTVDGEQFFHCRCIGCTDTQNALAELRAEGYKPRARSDNGMPAVITEEN